MGGIGQLKCSGGQVTSSLSACLWRAAARAVRIGRSRRYDPVEVERFIGDLSRATRRLVSREYRQSSFTPRNLLRIPERTEELFLDLTFYWSVGQVWREILHRIELPQYGRVAEVGCGYVPKVACGLHYAGFAGTIELIDPDGEALSHAARFLSLVGARCHATTRRGALSENPPARFDALFGNHLLDDLILSSYCARQGVEVAPLYACEERYAAVWDEIVTDASLIDHVVPALADTLVASVRPGGVVALLDYPSFTHRALGLTHVMSFVRQVALSLRRALTDRGATSLELLQDPVTFDRLTVSGDDLVAFRCGGSDGEL